MVFEILWKKPNKQKHKEWYQSILNKAVFQTGWQHDICKVASESESTNIVPTHSVECEGEGNVLAAGTKKTRNSCSQLTDGAKNSAWIAKKFLHVSWKPVAFLYRFPV